MELRQIQYFIEVAKREHVSEAAMNLHVAQSAVSRQISNLEADLGVKLFLRDGRNVKLTHIGRKFLEHMEQAMQVIENAKLEIAQSLDPERGTVRIGFPSSLAASTLPTAISAFRELHPLAKFELHQGSYRFLINAVAQGKIDIAFIGPVPNEENLVKGHVLFIEDIVALLPIDHPLANETSIHLSQLKDDSFIVFPEGFVLRGLVVEACERAGYEPTVSFEGDDIDAIKGLVAAGLGVTLIPEITLIDSLPRQTVKIPIREPKVTRTVGVITPLDRELLPTEQLFYEFIKEFFKNQ
jgi:LysR family transcriptional activator of glutamate synthase operon